MRKSLAMFLAVTFGFAGAAMAASSGPSTHARNFVISGSGTAAAPADVDTTGACNASPWVDQCSGTSCSCVTLTGSKVSGSGSKGVSLTEFFVTIDPDINPASEGTVGGGPNPKCNPIRGEVAVMDSSSDSTTVDFLGVTCKHVIKVSSKNPGGSHDKDTLLGGWGIAASTVPMSGWGTFVGTVNQSNNAVSLKMSGWVTK
jgi:hypothetical protein